MTQIERDAALIRQMGGATKVAELLGLTTLGSVQRVQNWLTRGIPDSIKVEYPHLFLPHLFTQQPPQDHESSAPTATQTVAAQGS